MIFLYGFTFFNDWKNLFLQPQEYTNTLHKYTLLL